MQPQLHYLKTLWLLQAIENFCQIPIVAPTSVFLKVQKQKLEFNSNYLAYLDYSKTGYGLVHICVCTQYSNVYSYTRYTDLYAINLTRVRFWDFAVRYTDFYYELQGYNVSIRCYKPY